MVDYILIVGDYELVLCVTGCSFHLVHNANFCRVEFLKSSNFSKLIFSFRISRLASLLPHHHDTCILCFYLFTLLYNFVTDTIYTNFVLAKFDKNTKLYSGGSQALIKRLHYEIKIGCWRNSYGGSKKMKEKRKEKKEQKREQ